MVALGQAPDNPFINVKAMLACYAITFIVSVGFLAHDIYVCAAARTFCVFFCTRFMLATHRLSVVCLLVLVHVLARQKRY
jgi:hypothetical protein